MLENSGVPCTWPKGDEPTIADGAKPEVTQDVLDEYAELIKELGDVETELETIDAEEAAAVAAAAEKRKEPNRRKQRKLRRLAKLDTDYGDQLFAEAQHLDLPTGQTGRQKSTEVKVTGKAEAVVKRLLRLGRRDLVTEVYELKVDKQAAKKKENLPVVAGVRGLRVEDFETPWVKPVGRQERIKGPKRRIGIRRRKS